MRPGVALSSEVEARQWVSLKLIHYPALGWAHPTQRIKGGVIGDRPQY
jgi:hypothetical protein